MKRPIFATVMVVALTFTARGRADDAPATPPRPPPPTASNQAIPHLRLELDAAYRPIFDVASSGGEASLAILAAHGVASVLVDVRAGLGATAAGVHTWGLAGGFGVELAFEPLRIDLEAVARCLVYVPVSDVSSAHACGVGARPALLVDVLRFGDAGALFAEASIEGDYFGDSLESLSPSAGIGARF
jgi:hypothetical protein